MQKGWMKGLEYCTGVEKNSCGEKETVAMQKVFKAMDRRMCRII